MRAANKGYEAGTVLYMALELSSKTWKVAFSDGTKIRKTNVDGRDRVDVEKLLDLLMRYYAGFRRAFSTVRVPSMDDEAGQRLHRQWSRQPTCTSWQISPASAIGSWPTGTWDPSGSRRSPSN